MLSFPTFPFLEMEWPKFDFAKCSHNQTQLLSSAGKSNCGSKKSRSKVCHSDFENIKSRKKESSTKGSTVQDESIIILHQQMLPKSNSPTRSQGDPFQTNRKINTERIPPLSPVLVNGFLKNPTVYSPIPPKDSNSHSEELLTSSRCVDSSISNCEDLITPTPIFTPPPVKQLLLSGESPIFSLRGLKVVPRSQTFANQSQIGTSVTVVEESDNMNSICNYSPKLHESPSTAASISTHALDSSLTSLETLPPSQIDHKTLNKNKSFPNLDLMNSSLSFETDKSIITIRHTRSDSDVFQNHTKCVDDSGSVTTTSEQSRDCFIDVAIHEIEPNDPNFETKLSVQSTSSPTANQSKIYDFQEENGEGIQQKQYHRLSKLAETLKKRLFISSSDLAMWKCEESKQHPVRQVTVISSVEQWGFCWTLVKNVSDSETAHIVDSEPMKKNTDVLTRNRSQKRRNAVDERQDRRCHDSPQQNSEETFSLYQPLSKLNTSLGEFVLSPRYYR